MNERCDMTKEIKKKKHHKKFKPNLMKIGVWICLIIMVGSTVVTLLLYILNS